MFEQASAPLDSRFVVGITVKVRKECPQSKNNKLLLLTRIPKDHRRWPNARDAECECLAHIVGRPRVVPSYVGDNELAAEGFSSSL